jgi:hypothetical protein
MIVDGIRVILLLVWIGAGGQLITTMEPISAPQQTVQALWILIALLSAVGIGIITALVQIRERLPAPITMTMTVEPKAEPEFAVTRLRKV